MRTTTIIAPLASTRTIVNRSTPVGSALRGIGLGAILLAFGLVYLFLTPVAWCLKKLGAMRSGS